MKWDFIFVWLASKARFRKKGIRHNDMDDCLNCGFDLNKTDLFCPECGQKVHYSKLTIWSLLAEFFANLFNLDGSMYRSIWYLPIPGHLSKKFISGKRKKYLNPIRFFLVALVIHITVITNILPIENLTRSNIQQFEELGKERLYEKYMSQKDSLAEIYGQNNLDSLEKAIFEKVDTGKDSIIVNGNSVERGVFYTTWFTSKTYRFKRADFFDMEMNQFMTSYKLESYWEKVLATQVLRAARDTPGALRFAIGNLIWIIFLVIILEGLFMKLLYIRTKRYYVEHLVVLFNIHTFSFLLGSLGLWLGFTLIGPNPDNQIVDISYLIIIIFFFLSIKYYYQQGWIKSFIKFCLISFMYLILMIAMVVFVTVISFMLF